MEAFLDILENVGTFWSKDGYLMPNCDYVDPTHIYAEDREVYKKSVAGGLYSSD